MTRIFDSSGLSIYRWTGAGEPGRDRMRVKFDSLGFELTLLEARELLTAALSAIDAELSGKPRPDQAEAVQVSEVPPREEWAVVQDPVGLNATEWAAVQVGGWSLGLHGDHRKMGGRYTSKEEAQAELDRYLAWRNTRRSNAQP